MLPSILMKTIFNEIGVVGKNFNYVLLSEKIFNLFYWHYSPTYFTIQKFDSTVMPWCCVTLKNHLRKSLLIVVTGNKHYWAAHGNGTLEFVRSLSWVRICVNGNNFLRSLSSGNSSFFQFTENVRNAYIFKPTASLQIASKQSFFICLDFWLIFLES